MQAPATEGWLALNTFPLQTGCQGGARDRVPPFMEIIPRSAPRGGLLDVSAAQLGTSRSCSEKRRWVECLSAPEVGQAWVFTVFASCSVFPGGTCILSPSSRLGS